MSLRVLHYALAAVPSSYACPPPCLPCCCDIQPQLVDPANGHFQPSAGGTLYSPTLLALHVYPLPAFQWVDLPGAEPTGNLANQKWVDFDKDGVARGAVAPPGAFL